MGLVYKGLRISATAKKNRLPRETGYTDGNSTLLFKLSARFFLVTYIGAPFNASSSAADIFFGQYEGIKGWEGTGGSL